MAIDEVSSYSSKDRRHSSGSASSNLSDLLSDSADPTLAALREKRLGELRASAKAHAATTESIVAVNAPGYGIPAILTEAIAIQTTADAAASLLLFSHADMATCARMRAHLDRVSAAHTNVACVVVEAEKAPWLAGRMGVRVLPALIGMQAGKETGRLVGFEGLERGMNSSWRDVEKKVKAWGVIADLARRDEGSEDEEEEERKENGRREGKSIRVGGPRSKAGNDDEDSDWD